ncbi:MAG TPA: aromatic amino acid lyase, partial [Solirubrobacteraceae bacterium]
MATQNVWASLGVESHASLAATAARHTEGLLEAMETLVATELAVAVRALRMAGRVPAGGETGALFEASARAIPPAMADRAFGRDIERARRALAEWSRGGAPPAVQ